MAATPSPTAGYLNALRTLGGGLLDSVHDRFELFTTELQEEKLRLFQTLIWISAGIFVAMMAVPFFSLTVVSLMGATARPIVLGSLTALYVAALIGVAWGFRRHQAHQAKPFAGTLNELRQDSVCIRTQN